MAKPPRPKEEVEQIKEKILNAALDIIIREGYENLSMRNIARRIGMTAANLYNYFSSKDELYLTLLRNAFQKLNNSLRYMVRDVNDPLQKLMRIGEAYINFAIKNKNYYEIMLMTSAPRYSDFIGTEMERLAYESKKTGIEVFNFILDILTEAFPEVGPGKARLILLELWSNLHGIVSLYNYGVLQELEDRPIDTLNRVKELAFEIFQDLIKKFSEKR